MCNDIVKFVKNNDHKINLLIFGASGGLISMTCYYFFNKLWARIVFGILLFLTLAGIISIIVSGHYGKILDFGIKIFAGMLASLIFGILIGTPKWKKEEI